MARNLFAASQQNPIYSKAHGQEYGPIIAMLIVAKRTLVNGFRLRCKLDVPGVISCMVAKPSQAIGN
jgi:hypothetical protein